MAASWDTGPDTGWDSAGWQRPGAGGTRKTKLSAGTIEGGATRAPSKGRPGGQSNQRHRRGAPLTCPRTWSSRKARPMHRLGGLCTLCMIRLFPLAFRNKTGRRRSAPLALLQVGRPPLFPGRTGLGFIARSRDALKPVGCRAGRKWGGPAGWGMERTPGLPWQLAVGAALLRARPWGLRVPVCGDWLFPERREGQGGVARPGPRARSSAWEGNARFLLEAALPSPRTDTPALPTAPRAGRSKRGCERGALLEGCLQFGAICGGLAKGPGV